MPSKTISGGSFQTATGTLLNAGKLVLEISQPSYIVSTGQMVTTPVVITLDASGDAPSTAIWYNDELSPDGTYYNVSVLDSNGNVQYETHWVLSGASPINLDTLTPTIADPSYATPVLQNPQSGNPQTIAGSIFIDGQQTDDITLTVQATAGQTVDEFVVETSAGTDHFAVDVNGVSKVKRIKASNATAIVAGDFALSAGWGNTATVSAVATGSKDACGEITVTSAGTGQAANPTITLTFKDGTWTTAPFPLSKQVGGSGAIADITETATATTMVLTWNGTPSASATYIIRWHCLGGT